MSEFYRMPAFTTLLVQDVERSVAWYTKILGFTLVYSMPGVGGGASLSHLRFSKYADLMLMASSEKLSSQKNKGFFLTFSLFDAPIDEVAARLVTNKIPDFDGPHDRPWNARELVITDLDGYKIIITQPINNELSISEVVNSVKNS